MRRYGQRARRGETIEHCNSSLLFSHLFRRNLIAGSIYTRFNLPATGGIDKHVTLRNMLRSSSASQKASMQICRRIIVGCVFLFGFFFLVFSKRLGYETRGTSRDYEYTHEGENFLATVACRNVYMPTSYTIARRHHLRAEISVHYIHRDRDTRRNLCIHGGRHRVANFKTGQTSAPRDYP